MENRISPIDSSLINQVKYKNDSDALLLVEQASIAQSTWKSVSLSSKQAILKQFLVLFKANQDEIANELCLLIGRPLKHCFNEVNTAIDRANQLIELSNSALDTTFISDLRYIKRVPVGCVFVIAPWNYPYLCVINVLIPSLLAGNAILVKSAPQTFSCSAWFERILLEAGLPVNLYTNLEISHQVAAQVSNNDHIQLVSFTGSVAGGSQVSQNLAGKFKQTSFELGGKDPVNIFNKGVRSL